LEKKKCLGCPGVTSKMKKTGEARGGKDGGAPRREKT